MDEQTICSLFVITILISLAAFYGFGAAILGFFGMVFSYMLGRAGY